MNNVNGHSLRNRLIGALLVLGSTIFCLVGFELALRVAGYDPFRNVHKQGELILRESANPDMIYEMTPNSEGFAWGADFKINSYGFRDREYNIKKPDGIYRIVVIGDSTTVGYYLPLEATYPKRLEKLFGQQGIPAEVLNLGVAGYDTIQEVAFLKQVGVQYKPDEVIVGYCMNDVGVVSHDLDYIRRVRGYEDPIYNFRVMQFLREKTVKIWIKSLIILSKIKYKVGIVDSKHIPDILDDPYVKDRIRQIENQLSTNFNFHRTFKWYKVGRKLRKIRSEFGKLKSLSRRHGFKVTVLIIPYLHSRIDVYDAAYDIVRHEARRNNFNVIEVLPAFTDAGVSNLRLDPADGIHPNELGHHIMAKKLFEFYKDDLSKRIPSSPTTN